MHRKVAAGSLSEQDGPRTSSDATWRSVRVPARRILIVHARIWVDPTTRRGLQVVQTAIPLTMPMAGALHHWLQGGQCV